jgi:transposase
MAFICKKKNREGNYYVFLCEAYRKDGRSHQRTLKNFGPLKRLIEENPNAYEELRERNANGEFAELSQTEQVIVEHHNINSPIGTQKLLDFGWKSLEGVFDDLDIDKITRKSKSKSKYDLYEALKLLVLERILHPASKSATVKNSDNLYGNWNIKINDAYRSLDRLCEIKDDIQLQIHKTVTEKIGRTATLVFYDATNYYFEIDSSDIDEVNELGIVVEEGMRRRGASKEKRPKPIIQMGMFMDLNGIPISYKLFRGNEGDPKTYIPAIEQVKKQFGIERIITVADKAMNSIDNVSKAYENGEGWLFSSKLRGSRGAPKDIQTFALDEKNWSYNSDKTFGWATFNRVRKLNGGKTAEEKVLITYRQKYAIREKYKRMEVLKIADKMSKAEIERQLMGKGVKRYLTAKDPETGKVVRLSDLYEIDTEKVKFDERFDGMNTIVTSETDMTNDQMIDAYGQLNRIEDCFRITKTDLETRPVRHSQKTRIEAHFLTCFVALVVLKITKYKIGKSGKKYSLQKVLKHLQSAKLREMNNGYLQLFTTKKFQKISKILGKNYSKAYYKKEEFKKI